MCVHSRSPAFVVDPVIDACKALCEIVKFEHCVAAGALHSLEKQAEEKSTQPYLLSKPCQFLFVDPR